MTRERAADSDGPSVSVEWLGRLERMSEAVTAWRQRATDPVPPQPGSSLAGDALDGLPIESAIWYSMSISSEHLDFAISSMRATSTMYPTAYMTVARTAVVAAVNAVWLLAPPSRTERRRRALRLRADELRVQVTSYQDMNVPRGDPLNARDALLERLRSAQDALQAVAAVLSIAEDVRKIRFNQTAAIDWVAQHMHGAGNDLLIGAMQSIWRAGSAAAHAQVHFGTARVDRNEVSTDADGRSILRLRGDLDLDVGPALAGATLTLSEAFRLYDLRRSHPTS